MAYLAGHDLAPTAQVRASDAILGAFFPATLDLSVSARGRLH